MIGKKEIGIMLDKDYNLKSVVSADGHVPEDPIIWKRVVWLVIQK